MNARELAIKIDDVIHDYDPYTYNDSVEDRESSIDALAERIEAGTTDEIDLMGTLDTIKYEYEDWYQDEWAQDVRECIEALKNYPSNK